MSDDVGFSGTTAAEWRDYCFDRAQRALDPFIGDHLPLTQEQAARMAAALEHVYQVLKLEALGYSHEEAETIARSSGG